MVRVVEKFLKVMRVTAAMLLKMLENWESLVRGAEKILEDGSRLHAPG